MLFYWDDWKSVVMMKKLVAVSLICCSLLGCETADGVMSGVKSVAEGVTGDIDKVRNKY